MSDRHGKTDDKSGRGQGSSSAGNTGRPAGRPAGRVAGPPPGASHSTSQAARPSGGFRGGGRHGGPIESPTDFKAALSRLIKYFGGQWPYLIVVVVAVIASATLNSMGPAKIGNAIKNHIEMNPNAELLIRSLIVVLAIYGFSWIADALTHVFMVKAGNQLIYRMRQDTFSHLQTLSMPFFDKRGVGDLISRVTNDIEMIYNAMVNGFTSLARGLFLIFGIVIAMLSLNLQLSLVVIAVTPVMFFITAIIGKLVRKAFRKNQMLVGKLNGKIAESVSSVKVIQTFRKEDDTFSEFEEISSEARQAGERAEIVGFALHPIMRFMNGFTLALVVGIGGYLVLRGGDVYSIGLITAFILYARRFFEPLRQMTQVYNLINSALAGAERVFEILDTQPEIKNHEHAVKIEDIRGDVEFKDVVFAYVEDQTVLGGISLSAKSGQVVAVVGPTGAGKTTLVNLLSRFYDVQSGEITIDGRDIREIELDSLRKKMGVVLQEPYFFADTIMQNIKYGNPVATEEEAIKAAQTARADEFIRRLPEGYDTKLLERGMNLSQGERQLLAIARAVLADPRILILDEATSSVDSLTEAQIQHGLLELMKGRTSFIIAHRLSTIRNADQVLVLHNQQIIERGTHNELMAAEGFYSRLYKLQFERPEITEEMNI